MNAEALCGQDALRLGSLGARLDHNSTYDRRAFPSRGGRFLTSYFTNFPWRLGHPRAPNTKTRSCRSSSGTLKYFCHCIPNRALLVERPPHHAGARDKSENW
jgi:hypothetical protein